MPIGYWESEHLLAPADLTVIGAGIVGMSTALHYKALRPQERVRIVEHDVLGEGGTTRNAGFACFGGPGEWLDDVEALGHDAWKSLVQSRIEGLCALIDLLGETAIGLEWSGGWELFDDTPAGRKRAQQAADALEGMNTAIGPLLAAALQSRIPGIQGAAALVPDAERARHFGAHAAIQLPWEGMLHTGHMVSSFHRALHNSDIQCLHGCAVNGLKPADAPGAGWRLQTARGEMHSKRTAICTNGFARQFLPDLNVEPAPNRVLVVTPRKPLPPGTYHVDDGYLYFRTLPKGQVLFGGGRHFDIALPPLPERSPSAEAAWDTLLLEHAKRWLGPVDEVTHSWTGWLGVGKDRGPIMGTLAPGLHHAVRLGGMGVAIGCGLGRSLAEQLHGEPPTGPAV